MKKNIAEVVLDALGVAYTRLYVRNTINEEPYANSLYGLANLLARFKIESQCISVDDKTGALATGTPFVYSDGKIFRMVTSVSDGEVISTDGSGLERRDSIADFVERWDGIGLFVEKTPYTVQPDLKNAHRVRSVSRLKIGLLVGSLAVLSVLAAYWSPFLAAWWWWAALIIDMVGVAVCVLLMRKDLHIPTPVADRLCGLIKDSRCEDVTSSAGADIFGIMKLSELGLGFFTVGVLILLAFPDAVPGWSMISLAVLPFTFWSVWYQKFRLHSWCVLCLTTLVLMWLQAGVLMPGISVGFSSWRAAEVIVIAGIGFAILSCAVIAGVVKRLYLSLLEARIWKRSYNTLKIRPVVMKALLDEMPVAEQDPDSECGLLFGNENARDTLTVYSNPYCGPCAEMHPQLHNLPGEDLRIRYILTFFSADRSRINRYIIAARQQLGSDKAWDVIGGWFGGGKAHGEKYFMGLGLDPDTPEVEEEFHRQAQWHAAQHLSGTPTVLFNGRVLNSPFTPQDYIYIR